MAFVEVKQPANEIPSLPLEPSTCTVSPYQPLRHDVTTTMNYYKEREGVTTPVLDMG